MVIVLVVELPDNWAGKLQEYWVALLTPVIVISAEPRGQKLIGLIVPPVGKGLTTTLCVVLAVQLFAPVTVTV